MQNEIIYIQAINFINIFHTRQGNETQKIKHNPEN